MGFGVRCAHPNLQGFVADDEHLHGVFPLDQVRHDAAVVGHHPFHFGTLLGGDANAEPFPRPHKAQT